MTTFDLPDYVAGFNPGGSVIPAQTMGPVASGGSAFTTLINITGMSQVYLSFAQLATGDGRYLVQFFADPLGATPVGPSFYFRKNTTRLTDLLLPVVGPFMSVFWTNNTGGTTSAQVSGVGLTSAVTRHPKQISGIDTLVDQSGAALGASATVTVLPTNPFGGATEQYSTKARVLASCGQNATLVAQLWNGTTWDTFYGVSVPALTNVIAEMNLPYNDYRFQVTNGSASATTFNLLVVAED